MGLGCSAILADRAERVDTSFRDIFEYLTQTCRAMSLNSDTPWLLGFIPGQGTKFASPIGPQLSLDAAACENRSRDVACDGHIILNDLQKCRGIYTLTGGSQNGVLIVFLGITLLNTLSESNSMAQHALNREGGSGDRPTGN